MMVELGNTKREVIRPLCEHSLHVLVQGALEGRMGQVFIPTLMDASCCFISVGRFNYVFGLPPKGAKAMDLKSQIIINIADGYLYPADDRWAAWIEEAFGGCYRMKTRYALKKGEYRFDPNALKQYVEAIPEGYRIKPMDNRSFNQAKKETWSERMTAYFPDFEDFAARGAFGFVVYKGHELVSGCAARGVSNGQMELLTMTKKEHQKKGLALACSAAFVLKCIENNLLPNWDTDNLAGVALAEKLGYVFDCAYQIYQISPDIGLF